MTAHLGTRKRKRLKNMLLERDGPWCTWCCRYMLDEPILPDEYVASHMTLEHLIPRSKGGTDDPSNLALSCFMCNNARGDQDIEFDPPWRVEFDHDVVDQAHRGED